MSRENVLFSVIGVLLGFIVGFIFTNTVNQRAATNARTPATRGAQQPPAAATSEAADESLPPNHPSLSTVTVKDQQALESAVGEAARKARQSPADFDAQMDAADLYAQLRRYDDSLEFLLRANEIKPDNYEAVVALGNVNYDAGKFEAAERWYTAALAKKPDDVNVRTDLGLSFLLREPPDVERAVSEFRRSLSRDPRHEPTLQNMVVALIRKKDFAGARDTLARLQGVNPNNAAIASLRGQIESELQTKGSS